MKRTGTTSTTGLAVVLLLVAALLGACGGGAGTGGGGGESAGTMADEGRTGGEAPKSGRGQSDGQGGDVVARVVPGIRAEIRTAETTVRVDDARAAARRAQAAAQDLGGVVAAAEARKLDDDGDGVEEAHARMTLRVPNESLSDFLRSLAALGEEIDTSESTKDVSAEVADVASRVANQEASIAQLRRFMKRAREIEDVLRVEAELTRRQADLEALQARQRVLADRTALATVTATFVEGTAVRATDDADMGFLAGLRGGWNALVSMTLVAATVLGALLPFTLALAILAVPVALLWRARGRMRPRPAAE